MLTKQTIRRFIECPRLGYFDARGIPSPASRPEGGPAVLLHRAHGRMLGARARAEFAGGVLIDARDFRAALAETERAIEGGAKVLFEAAFEGDSIRARPDVLVREKGGRWLLWEVKSGAELKDEYLIDLAVQVHVLESCGRRAHPGLLLVDRNATTESPTIFRRVDCAPAVRRRMPDVTDAIDSLRSALASTDPPAVSLARRCRDCEFLPACWPDLPSPSVLDLYQGRGGWRNVETLLEKGVRDIALLHPDADLTDLQRRQVDAVRTGLSAIDRKAGDHLRRTLRRPLHFLDFEAARFPIPEFPGQHPYDLIPFQWSCHTERIAGETLSHGEFLWDRPGDPRRSLAEALLRHLGWEGSIVVYSHFEQEVLRHLADLLPDLAPEIEKLERRLFDLLPVVRRSCYHPAFGGSFSIKAVLPVLAPGSSYDGLAIGDGLEAVWSYHRLVHDEIESEERVRLADDLRAYCEQDSRALHAIHEALCREETAPKE
jgi:predicted RecB family nuclease